MDGKKQFTMCKENIIKFLFVKFRPRSIQGVFKVEGIRGSSQVILIVLYCIYHKGCNVAVDDVLAEDCCMSFLSLTVTVTVNLTA